MGFMYKEGNNIEDCHIDVLKIIADITLLKATMNDILDTSNEKEIIAMARKVLQEIE